MYFSNIFSKIKKIKIIQPSEKIAEISKEKLLSEISTIKFPKKKPVQIFADELRKSMGNDAILLQNQSGLSSSSVLNTPKISLDKFDKNMQEKLENEKTQNTNENEAGINTGSIIGKKIDTKIVDLQIEKNQEIEIKKMEPIINEKISKLNEEIMEYKEKLKIKENDYENKCLSNQRKNNETEKLKAELQDEKEKSEQNRKSLDSLTNSITILNKQLEIYEDQRRAMHKYIQQLKGNIRVFCRVKPSDTIQNSVNFPELFDPTGKSIKSATIQTLTMLEIAKNTYIFDRVFPQKTSQNEVFDEVSPFLQSALDGENVTIFAYGQTGSGKTYTMEGPASDELFIDGKLTENSGILPRAAKYIFNEINRLSEKGYKFNPSFSAIEIYNEELRDMLISEFSENSESTISLSSTKEGTEIKGLIEKQVNSIEDIINLIKIASSNRKTGKTAMNERSSRSHSIYRIKLIGEKPGSKTKLTGLLNIVDLAGSERASKDAIVSKNEILMKEAKFINQSLTTLGRVLTMLADRRATKKAAIPYRESKLTRVLQNSLQFESKTLMFVNICPMMENIGQSKESLRFASTASLAC